MVGLLSQILRPDKIQQLQQTVGQDISCIVAFDQVSMDNLPRFELKYFYFTHCSAQCSFVGH